MNLAPANTQLTFEVSFDQPSLNVAMLVYDTTGVSPVLVQGPAAMTNLALTNTYQGKFTPDPSKTYVLVKSVYTDNTFTTLSPNYESGSESIVSESFFQSSSDECNTLIGFICNPTLIGLVVC
jgi:hypothetical protein